MRLPLFILASSFGILTAVACSSSSTGTTSGGTSGGNAAISTGDCTPRCTSKATTCGATSDQAGSTCQSICASSTTQQISCLEGQTCSNLMTMDLNTLCPKGEVGSTSGGTSGGTSGATSGGTSGGGSGLALGASCTCTGATGDIGECGGTSGPCQSDLSCIYSGGMGKGTCYAASCCDMTSACDANKSLLKPCTTGTCQTTPLGYFCGK